MSPYRTPQDSWTPYSRGPRASIPPYTARATGSGSPLRPSPSSPSTLDVDPALVFLFALFHDSMRLNDGHDPLHGPRGAALARELHGGPFEVEDEEMGLASVRLRGAHQRRHRSEPDRGGGVGTPIG